MLLLHNALNNYNKCLRQTHSMLKSVTNSLLQLHIRLQNKSIYVNVYISGKCNVFYYPSKANQIENGGHTSAGYMLNDKWKVQTALIYTSGLLS